MKNVQNEPILYTMSSMQALNFYMIPRSAISNNLSRYDDICEYFQSLRVELQTQFMKQFFLLLSALILSVFSTHAQNPCGQGRYIAEIFPDVNTLANIQFGSNVQPAAGNPNATQTLFLDVYEPENDTLEARPLIIFAFPGGFITGTRQDADVVILCERFAKRGYVTASIDYRLSPTLLFNQNERFLYLSILKAVHDMKAAIRFFRHDADSANAYRIDTSKIFIAGISAGGVTSVHAAYLDASELPASIAQDTAAIGGIEGLSGTPGYSTEVLAAINLCGAIGDTSWMDNSQTPVISLHGTNDQVVPYGSTDDFFGASFVVHGSGSMQQHADRNEINSKLLTWQGADHVPFQPGQPNWEQFMDEAVSFISTNLSPFVCVESSSTSSFERIPLNLRVYPQPADEIVYVEWDTVVPDEIHEVHLFDMAGRTLSATITQTSDRISILRNQLPAGIYYLSILGKDGSQKLTKKITFRN